MLCRDQFLHSNPGTVGTVLSRERILDAAIGIGLDRFTIAGIARDLEVTDMAIYRYVHNREELYARAAARAHSTAPFRPSGTTDWQIHLLEVADSMWRLAHRYPGIERYLLNGPYYDETLAIFDTNMGHLSRIAPQFDAEASYLLLSRVTSVALAAANNALAMRHQEDPDEPGPLFGWTVRALIEGMAGLLARGELPSARSSMLSTADRVDDRAE